MCCRASFNHEKVVLGVLAKMELIRAEQLAGLMPSTWFQRKESLSTSVLSCLEKSKFSGSRSCYARFVARGEVPSNEVFELIASKIFHVKDCDGMPRFHPHEQVFRGASPNARYNGGNEVIDKIDNLCKGHALRHSNLLRKSGV